MSLDDDTMEKAVLAANLVHTKLAADEGTTTAESDTDLSDTLMPFTPTKFLTNQSKKRPMEVAQLSPATPSALQQIADAPLAAAATLSKKSKIDNDDDDNNYFQSMTVFGLKTECIKRGLKVSGKKADLLELLQSPIAANTSGRKTSSVFTAGEVEGALKRAGYSKPKDASACAKRAIQRGFILLDEEGMEKVLAKWSCCQCHKEVSATLRDCLDQPDYGGIMGDYKGALQCEDCGLGKYVSKMCDGSFEVTGSKFHNHCTECPGFGKCLGDYREMHCPDCKGHYFTGLSGYPCPCADRQADMAGMMCGMASGYMIGAMLGGDEEEAEALGTMYGLEGAMLMSDENIEDLGFFS